MPKVICNECGKMFELKEGCIETESIDYQKKIERQFLKCPQCGHKYTILITDPPVRDMIRQFKAIGIRLARLMNGVNPILTYKDIEKQHKDLLEKIRKRTSELKKEYEKDGFTE